MRLGKGGINVLEYSPDGTKLAVASEIGIWMYNAQTGEELQLYTGHTDFVNSIAFSPTGDTIVSGSMDGTVLLWEVIPPSKLNTTWGRLKTTDIFQNYPNPFNPETWIPYQLAKSADVNISIYNLSGKLIRTFNLGHQPIGVYRQSNRAAYWDGRNVLGEPVASGVYFYTLTAGEFTATRKMLILR